MSKEELKRQELIFELISTEDRYLKDLSLIVNVSLNPSPSSSISSLPLVLHSLTPRSSFYFIYFHFFDHQNFVLPLNQINALRREDIDIVFAGIEHILGINDAFYSDLRERQKQSVVMERIGDILLKRADSFLPYAAYIGERAKGDHMLAVISKNSHAAALFKVSVTLLLHSLKMCLC